MIEKVLRKNRRSRCTISRGETFTITHDESFISRLVFRQRKLAQFHDSIFLNAYNAEASIMKFCINILSNAPLKSFWYQNLPLPCNQRSKKKKLEPFLRSSNGLQWKVLRINYRLRFAIFYNQLKWMRRRHYVVICLFVKK